MKVFVLAPIHNRKETTLKFLRSFCVQTYPDYQMVIVDDGSTDGSSGAILSEFPKTVILKGDGNLWWTGSMNRGLEHILSVAKDEDFVIAINDDVTVDSDYIEKLVSLSEKNSKALVGSLYCDVNNKDIIYDSGVKIDWKKYRYMQVPYSKEKSIVSVDTLATRGTLIPIDVIKRIGKFEKRLKHYAADYEYFLRAKKAGYNLLLSYEAIVYGSEINSNKKEDCLRIKSFSEVWERNFHIKSPTNIFNHLFIMWHYCPLFCDKIRNIFILFAYNGFLFLNSIFLYPLVLIKRKLMDIKK